MSLEKIIEWIEPVQKKTIQMTDTEFKNHLESIYNSHPILNKSKRKTVNELFFMLRTDSAITDYNINIVDENGKILCVPSVKEAFVNVNTLAKHVKEIRCDGEDEYFDGLLLTVYVEE